MYKISIFTLISEFWCPIPVLFILPSFRCRYMYNKKQYTEVKVAFSFLVHFLCFLAMMKQHIKLSCFFCTQFYACYMDGWIHEERKMLGHEKKNWFNSIQGHLFVLFIHHQHYRFFLLYNSWKQLIPVKTRLRVAKNGINVLRIGLLKAVQKSLSNKISL